MIWSHNWSMSCSRFVVVVLASGEAVESDEFRSAVNKSKYERPLELLLLADGGRESKSAAARSVDQLLVQVADVAV